MDEQTAHEPRQETTGTSEARIRANRENAKRSTGPSTAQGKARSSLNALRHGIFANATRPIAMGHLREFAEDVTDFVASIVTELDPRNAIELAQATKVAGLFLAESRRDRFEAYRLEEAGRLSPADYRKLGGDPDDLQFQIIGLQHLWVWAQYLDELADDPAADEPFTDPDDQIFFKPMAELLHARLKPPIKIKGVWDDTHTPVDAAAWKVCLTTIISRRFATPKLLLTWADRLITAYVTRMETVHERAEALTAERSLSELERTINTGARISRELRNNYQFYRCLRSQPDAQKTQDATGTDT